MTTLALLLLLQDPYGCLDADELEARDRASSAVEAAVLRDPAKELPRLEAAAKSDKPEAAARARTVLSRLQVTDVAKGRALAVSIRAGGKPVEDAVVILESDHKENRRAVEPVAANIASRAPPFVAPKAELRVWYDAWNADRQAMTDREGIHGFDKRTVPYG